jgi:hypothetical protein
VKKRHVIINTGSFNNDMVLQGSVSSWAFRAFKYWYSVFPFGCKGLYSLFYNRGKQKQLVPLFIKHHAIKAYEGVEVYIHAQ